MKKNKRITIRFTEEEYKLIIKHCKKSKSSIADLLRHLVFNKIETLEYKKLSIEVSEQNTKTLRLLSNISNNLNQLTKTIHIIKNMNRTIAFTELENLNIKTLEKIIFEIKAINELIYFIPYDSKNTTQK